MNGRWPPLYANDNYAKFALEHHVARSPNLFVEYLDMTQWNLLLRTTNISFVMYICTYLYSTLHIDTLILPAIIWKTVSFNGLKAA